MLSPFEVSAETERGYQSTAVLQGGRGRIELADVAGQVAVFTKDFLEDIAATNIDEAYLFSTTTRTYYDNASGTSANTLPTTDSRGLGQLDQTRNFFRTSIAADLYNTERLSIVSGANAVQFGLGGAAGTSEHASARALFSKNHQRTQMRMDSYGSERGVIDISQVILKGKLAIRGIGLRENKEYFLRPGNEESRRGFVTTTYQPFRGTVLRVQGEYAYLRENRPSPPMARDVGYLSWLANPVTYNNRAATAATAGRPAAPSYTLPDGTVRNYGFNAKDALFVWPQNSIPAFSGLQDVRNTVVVPIADANNAAPNSQSFVLPGYPWNVNPLGFSKYKRRRSRNLAVTIEQRLGPVTFLELGYSWDFYRENTTQLMASNAFDVMVDINRFLPDGLTPNPLYGRAFTESNSATGQGSWTDSRIVQYRATLTHEFDLTRSTGWARHLGRHRLGLFASADDTTSYSLGNNRFLVLGRPSFLSQAAKDNPLHAERAFNMRFYRPPIGSTNDPFAYAIPDPSAYGDIMGVMNFTTPSGEPFQVSMYQNPVGFVGTTPSASHLQRGSAAASTSSSFFQNHLVMNVGVRHDRVRNSDYSAFIPILSANPPTPASPNGSGYLAFADFREKVPADVWTPYRQATRVNYGFVVRPPRVGSWLSLGYDYSRNASLNQVAVVRDVNGNEVEPPYGESHEYSVRLRLLADRLNLKLNYFNALRRNTTLPDSGLRQNLIDFEQQLYLNDSSYAINPLFKPALNPLPGNFRLPGDNNSRGIEAELTWNPSRDWRIFWNIGRIDAQVDDLSAQPWWDYLNAKLALWKTYKGNWSTATYSGSQSVENAWNSLIAGPLDEINASLGNPGANSQTWRSSLVATHMFSSGRLKGASASANVRYRGPALVGFPERVDEKGRGRQDRDHPYKSEEYFVVGLMANYRFRGPGNTACRVQLNTNNIFNTKRLYLTRTYANGTPRNYGRQPGREFILSLDVEH